MSRAMDDLHDVPGPQKHFGQSRTSGMAIASMIFGFLSLCLSLLASLPAIVLGVLSLNAISRSKGSLTGRGMAITGIVAGSLGALILPVLLLPAVQAAREAARRAQCTNNLKQIGLALLNYESANGCFPPAFSPDENGKPRCSWRVSILPYMEASPTYNNYNFWVAWDHASNATVINTKVSVYLCPSETSKPGEEMFTNYLMVTGPGTFFDAERAPITRIADIRDGLRSTIGVVQASRKVHWAAPDDLVVDPGQPLNMQQFKTPHPGGFQALFLDGSVRFVKDSVAQTTLRALLTVAGGEQPLEKLSY
jgi:prepilin-type processing-associated H-X9-DG protein